MTETLPIERFELPNRDGGFFIFNGQFLGEGSSAHPAKTRWFEVHLYKATDGRYIVQTEGRSIVEGEKTFIRIAETKSAFEVVELLTVNHGHIYIPRQSSRALAQAAQWDDDIRDAYVNRAVV